MSDWKSEIDARLNAEKEEERRRKETDRERQRKDQEAALAKRLERHQRRFKCHICGKPSSSPYIFTHSYMGNSTETREDWDAPGDLESCRRCRRLTCAKHIHQGICMNCAKSI